MDVLKPTTAIVRRLPPEIRKQGYEGIHVESDYEGVPFTISLVLNSQDTEHALVLYVFQSMNGRRLIPIETEYAKKLLKEIPDHEQLSAVQLTLYLFAWLRDDSNLDGLALIRQADVDLTMKGHTDKHGYPPVDHLASGMEALKVGRKIEGTQ